MHEPVLLKEVIASLDPRPGEFMIDGTADGGGHAAAILQKIAPAGTLLALDWDKALLAECRTRLGNDLRARFAHGNYADLPGILRELKMPKADGLLIDLGFSSEQLERSGRGFSFNDAAADEPLLMTYDDSREPVGVLLRSIDEEALANIIFELGGEHRSRQIAKAIKAYEKKKAIVTSGELSRVVRDALPASYERGRIDPATRTFQALRIYANDELGNLKRLLAQMAEIVKPGGRVAIISFHSVEDRIVKQAFQQNVKEAKAEFITKKPLAASRGEVEANPRSRSAKLRAITIK